MWSFADCAREACVATTGAHRFWNLFLYSSSQFTSQPTEVSIEMMLFSLFSLNKKLLRVLEMLSQPLYFQFIQISERTFSCSAKNRWRIDALVFIVSHRLKLFVLPISGAMFFLLLAFFRYVNLHVWTGAIALADDDVFIWLSTNNLVSHADFCVR